MRLRGGHRVKQMTVAGSVALFPERWGQQHGRDHPERSVRLRYAAAPAGYLTSVCSSRINCARVGSSQAAIARVDEKQGATLRGGGLRLRGRRAADAVLNSAAVSCRCWALLLREKRPETACSKCFDELVIYRATARCCRGRGLRVWPVCSGGGWSARGGVGKLKTILPLLLNFGNLSRYKSIAYSQLPTTRIFAFNT